MKKGITIFMLLLLCISATPTFSQQPKVTRKNKSEEKAILVKKIIDSKDYKILVNQANPLNGKNINLTTTYSLKIQGDSVYSYLPYFGRAYSIPYGGGEGLIFNSTITNYKLVYSKKGKATISFITNSKDDRISYTIDIYNNGSSMINALPNNRQSISYYGELETDNRK